LHTVEEELIDKSMADNSFRCSLCRVSSFSFSAFSSFMTGTFPSQRSRKKDLDNDPEKIGKHMLEMLAKIRNDGIAE